MNNGPLAGIRVLDASQMLAGPICAMRLADLGADVIKIEPPVGGEWTRTHGFANASIDGQTTAFLGINRNKRSVTANLKTDEGREVLHSLVEVSDVFIQNYRVGTAARLGVDYPSLRSRNERLVYASISGYGEDGPGAGLPGQDLVVQAFSGSMWSVGSSEDVPTPGALWAVDVMTGYQAAIGILSAIWDRQRTGLGQKVAVDMLSTVMDCQCQELTTYLNLGIKPKRSTESLGHAWVNAPYGSYETADGWIVIAMAPVHVLGNVVGDERLIELDQWDDAHTHRDEIVRRLRPLIRKRSSSEWLALFLEANIWAGEVYDYDQLCSDPQVQHRGLIATVDHPTIGALRLPNVPIELSETPASIRTAPPLLGQHTDEVLTELLGFDHKQLADLRAKGAI
jgi:crotonobetainyl-CoA:carnitine CoA-transferase CaiB-like acyl-CoA transferase